MNELTPQERQDEVDLWIAYTADGIRSVIHQKAEEFGIDFQTILDSLTESMQH